MVLLLPRLLTGCTPDSGHPSAEQGTVLVEAGENGGNYYTASWTSEGEGRTRVEVDDGDTPVFVTDWQAGADAEGVPLLGVWVAHEFTARLVDEGGTVLATTTFATDPGPNELSRMTTSGTATWTGYALTEAATADVQTALVLAPNGQVAWYWQSPREEFLGRGLARRDGLGVWLLGMPAIGGELPSWLGSVAWDGTLLVDTIPVGHDGEGLTHDLYELDDGRLCFLGPDTRELDGVERVAETLYALNLDGTETALWSFWDDFSPQSALLAPNSWSHANALRWNDDRQTLWVGSRELGVLVELDPTTWRPINQIGGPAPTFARPDGTQLPRNQHQFAFHGDRLAVHDNRDAESGSRIVVYDLDFSEGQRSIAQAWEYVPNPTIFDYVLGDLTWVDAERMVVTWSTSGVMEERSLDGDAPWNVTFDLGLFFAYTQLVPALPGSTPVAAK